MNIIMDIIDIAPSVLKSGRRGVPGSVLASMLAGVLIRRQAKMFDVNIAYGARVARGLNVLAIQRVEIKGHTPRVLART